MRELHENSLFAKAIFLIDAATRHITIEARQTLSEPFLVFPNGLLELYFCRVSLASPVFFWISRSPE